ncbi:MAG: hypothetical protein ABIE70_13765, partial [bacterium]
DYIALLDDLIARAYRCYLDPNDENVKLGELLKMFELRHKITPQNAEQRKFWSSMEKIRKQILSGSGESGDDKPTGTARRKGK